MINRCKGGAYFSNMQVFLGFFQKKQFIADLRAINMAMPSFHVDNKKRDSLVGESRLKR